MPLYQFACDRCGPFEEWRLYREAGGVGVCPRCGQAAPRTYAAPAVFGTAAAARAERAARAEPQVVMRPHHTSRTPHRAHGRPWAIGH
jgi:putative FmdB family regulatory protein